MATERSPRTPTTVRLDLVGLRALVDLLVADHDEVLGPVELDGVIRIGPVRSIDDLPVGRGDAAEPGSYRVVDRGDRARFGYAVGPDSLKAVVHPPQAEVWTAVRIGGPEPRIEVTPSEVAPIARAAIVRPCDASGLDVLSDVTAAGPHADPIDAPRMSMLTLVVVNCGAPTDTCCCASVGTGPAIGAVPHDVALTEVVDQDAEPWYLAAAGSARGAELLARTPWMAAEVTHREAAQRVTDGAAAAQSRTVPHDARQLVVDQPDHARWDDVGTRCVACTNCTMVCPTCFCTDVVDRSSLDGDATSRDRVWDSCFSTAFATLGGASLRPDARSKYRHWLTHKVGTWHDHFGRSGCVGCGRCITWCPVGIDLTAELAALARPSAGAEATT